MTAQLRAIVSHRKQAPEKILESLRPLEASASDQAIGVSAFKTLLLISHADTALPVTVGSDVLKLANEASFHAEEVRAKIAEMHLALAAIGKKYFATASGADCPPNEYPAFFTVG